MTQRGKGTQITAWPAAKIEKLVGRSGLDRREQGGDILADIMVAGADTEVFGAILIMEMWVVILLMRHC